MKTLRPSHRISALSNNAHQIIQHPQAGLLDHDQKWKLSLAVTVWNCTASPVIVTGTPSAVIPVLVLLPRSRKPYSTPRLILCHTLYSRPPPIVQPLRRSVNENESEVAVFCPDRTTCALA